MARGKLTNKERLFVAYYLGEAKCNGTKAAMLAGYSTPGQTAYDLLKKPQISEAIENKISGIVMTQEEVLMRLTSFARADMTDFVNFPSRTGPASLDLRKAKKRGKLSGVKKLKASRIDRGDDEDPLEVVEVELHNPIQALTLLAKYHGLIDKLRPDADEGDRKPRINIPESDARSEQVDPG